MIGKTILSITVILSLVAISLTFFILAFIAWPNWMLTLAFIGCDAVFSFFAFKVIRAIVEE